MSRSRLSIIFILLALAVGSALFGLAQAAPATTMSPAAQTQSIRVEPAADRCVISAPPTVDLEDCGDDGTWGVGFVPVAGGGEGEGSIYRALVRFDLPALPAGATLVTATLSAYTFEPPDHSESLATTSVKRIIDPWDEATVTWENQPEHLCCELYDEVYLRGGGRYYSWDVTPVASAWYAGTPNYGFKLVSNYDYEEGPLYRFWSRQAPGNRPYLEITYTLPPNLPHRNVDNVRVWASSFVDNPDGTVTATGNVIVGPNRDDGKYFAVGGSASWRGVSGPLSLSGAIGFVQGAIQFGSGSFTVDTKSGAVSWAPGNQVLYRKLGSSELTIDPTLTINVLQPQVEGSAQVNLALPENNAISPAVRFKVGFNGAVSASGSATARIQLRLAGGDLTADVQARSEGLVAAQAQYALAGVGTITLTDLVIDGKGTAKLRFGAAAEFSLPDLNIGDGFFVFSQLKGTLGLDRRADGSLAYVIGLSGKLSLSKLPENSQIQVNSVDLKIANGVLQGALLDFQIQVAGRPFKLRGVQFKRTLLTSVAGMRLAAASYRYELFAQGAEFAVPAAWMPQGLEPPTISIQGVVIQSETPYIKIGTAGATFSIDRAFSLAGPADANASVRFDLISGQIQYAGADHQWQVMLETHLRSAAS
jgi:hypothetical protein